MRKNLSDLQEEMRQRQNTIKENNKDLPRSVINRPVDRPLCIACNRRWARLGQPYCSRCSGVELQRRLRDVLPGTITTIPPTSIAGPITYTIPNVPASSIPQYIPQPVSNENGENAAEKPDSSKKQYSRREVCAQLGISQTTLSRWEAKGKTPMPRRLVHNQQCIYTDELIAQIKEYMSREFVPAAPAATDPITGVRVVRKPIKVRVNRKIERVVARLSRF